MLVVNPTKRILKNGGSSGEPPPHRTLHLVLALGS